MRLTPSRMIESAGVRRDEFFRYLNDYRSDNGTGEAGYLVTRVVKPLHAMFRFGAVILLPVATSGCESVWTVPPASGRVLDSHSRQPIVGASVTRIAMSGTTNQTTSDAEGCFRFRGKHSVQVFPFGAVLAWATYRIESPGYQMVETNRTGYGSISGLRHEFGEIPLSPR